MPVRSNEELLGIGPESASHGARREEILKELQAEASVATGVVRQVVRVMYDFVASTRPGATFSPELSTEIAAVFQRLTRAAKRAAQTNKKPLHVPAIIREANTFVVDHLASLKKRAKRAHIAVPEPEKVEGVADAVRSIADDMERASRPDTAERLGKAQHRKKAPPRSGDIGY